jgi:hypothetical protein
VWPSATSVNFFCAWSCSSILGRVCGGRRARVGRGGGGEGRDLVRRGKKNTREGPFGASSVLGGRSARHPRGSGGRPRNARVHALEARGVEGERASRSASRAWGTPRDESSRDASRRVILQRVGKMDGTHLRGDRGEVPAVAGVLRQHGGPAGHERVDERHRDTLAFARGLALISRKLLRVFVRFHVVLFPKNRSSQKRETRRRLCACPARVASRVCGKKRKKQKSSTARAFQSGINLIEKTCMRASLRPVKSPDSRNSWRSARRRFVNRAKPPYPPRWHLVRRKTNKIDASGSVTSLLARSRKRAASPRPSVPDRASTRGPIEFDRARPSRGASESRRPRRSSARGIHVGSKV